MPRRLKIIVAYDGAAFAGWQSQLHRKTVQDELERALEINPVSYNFLADLGQAYYYAGDYRKAEKACLSALDIYPEFMFAHGSLSTIYFQTGEYEKAIEELAISLTKLGTLPYQPGNAEKEIERIRRPLLQALQSGGMVGFWRHQLEGINKSDNQEGNRFIGLARAYTALGDKENALNSLERALERKAFLMPFVAVDPALEGLRSEPRFQEILRSMKLVG